MVHQHFFPQASVFYRQNDTDHKWHGDDISTFKEPGVTRIMFHNVNGLALHGPKGIDMFVNEQDTLHVNIQGISEHCLDSTKIHVTHTANKTLRENFPGTAMLQLSSSSESTVNTYKPGGTGLLLSGPTTGILEPNGKGSDHMGRWSFIHLCRQNQPPLTVILAYQVCQRPTNQIGVTAYDQQQRMLNQDQ
jgi:hypothetical protein